MTLSRNQITTAFAAVFYLAGLAVLLVALAPVEGQSGSGVDKLQHITAFYGLTLLALAAHPNRNLITLSAGLAAFGALIEGLQGLAIFARDRDIADWVADMVGIGLAMAPLLPAAWRRTIRKA